MTTSMATAISSLLKTSLDRLYGDFNYPDSATDPIHIVRRFERADDREIVGFCAAGLAFGRVASVLQSIERLLAVLGPLPPSTCGRSRRGRRSTSRASGTGGSDRTISWRSSGSCGGCSIAPGSVERFFAEGYEAGASDVGAALDSFSRRGAGDRARGAAVEAIARGLLFLSPAVRGLRVQAPEPVPAMDGAPRRARSRRVDDRAGVGARRAARHARHQGGTLPRADALRQPRVGDGPGDHRRAARARPGRSREIRLLAVPPRHDERLRVQPRAAGLSVSVTWGLPAARA